MPSQPRTSITPTVLLQLQGWILLVLSCALYQHLVPHHWLLFAALFLLPDLSLLGYATGPTRLAALLYNAAHSYTLPLILGFASYAAAWHLGIPIALIWCAHIAFDRGLGYGLKFAEGFKPTHIQRAGVWRDEPDPPAKSHAHRP
jgi:Domain of unknown function (DUF4260)